MFPSLTKPSLVEWPSPEESLTTQSEETTPESAQPAYTDSPVEEAAVKVTEEEAAPVVRPAQGPVLSRH